jgi:hypothetical protein
MCHGILITFLINHLAASCGELTLVPQQRDAKDVTTTLAYLNTDCKPAIRVEERQIGIIVLVAFIFYFIFDFIFILSPATIKFPLPR